MRKIQECRIETRDGILQQIKVLEVLRPSLAQAGHEPLRYAYSKPMAALKVLTKVLLGGGLLAAIIFTIFHYGEEISSTSPAGIVFIWILSGIFIGLVLSWITGFRKTYLLVNQKTLRSLKQEVSRYQAIADELEQKRHDAEIYRPKFDRLRSIIVEGLHGSYEPHWWPERHACAKISFDGYEAEWYDFNQEDYSKLLSRLLEARLYTHGSIQQRADFVQDCEARLGL